jgi:tetratricopeptide (TPR) repeat protein
MKPAQIAMAVLGMCVAAGGTLVYRRHAYVTFNHDLAPVAFKTCAPCHRPGQAGPFSLLRYEDYVEHASDIRDLVEDRLMPPWEPVGPKAQFKGDRSLTPEQRALFLRWVDQGKREGEFWEKPAPPVFPSGFQLGKPDLIVRIPEPYVLAADGRDIYRNFVIPAQVIGKRYVVAWEFVPHSRAVHHAILYVDRLGLARKADAQDPEPGFSGMDNNAFQAPDGHYLVWAPGRTFAREQDGTAWSLDASADLVLQLHLQRTGKQETLSPEIALYFTDTPPTRARYSLRIGDPPIDIPAGQKNYQIEDALTLPADVDLLSLFPHAHYLATKIQVWAEPPGAAAQELLLIDHWDFKWQDEYTYAVPVRLPRGSVLKMRFTYDNSAANPSNPHRPPIRVVTGEQSTDEMGNVTLQVVPVHKEDMNALREAKFRRELARNGSAVAHYNLANTLMVTGRVPEAIEHYRAAVAKQPDMEPFQYNFAGALLGVGELDEAITRLRKAIELRPDLAPAYVHLGNTLIRQGHREEGLASLRRAVEVDPNDRAARAVLVQAQAQDAAAH